MSFTPPTFNLTCNIWRGLTGVANPPDVVSPCNLSPGRRVIVPMPLMCYPYNATTLLGLPHPSELLLPKGTDIEYWQGGHTIYDDVVEVPAGSGRYYICIGVEDVGKGFPNEYRLATICPYHSSLNNMDGVVAGSGWGPWPTPYP